MGRIKKKIKNGIKRKKLEFENKIEQIYPLTIVKNRFSIKGIGYNAFNCESIYDCVSYIENGMEKSITGGDSIDNYMSEKYDFIPYGYGDTIDEALHMLINNYEKIHI